MDYTLDLNYNKSYASVEEYKTIIYKYFDARKESKPIRELLRAMTRMIFPIISDDVKPIYEILGYIYLFMAKDKAEPCIAKFLESSPFQEGILSDDEIQILIKNRIEVTDYLCALSLHKSYRIKRKVAFVYPYYLDKVVISALKDLPQGSVIYNPCAGINSYAIAAPQFHFVGEEYSLYNRQIKKSAFAK